VGCLDLVAARCTQGQHDQRPLDFAQDAVIEPGCRQPAFVGRKIAPDMAFDRTGEALAARREKRAPRFTGR